MPRRNESSSGRKKTARPGGGKSFSGRGRSSSAKPFKRSDKDDSGSASSSGKSFGGKKNFSSGERPRRTGAGKGKPAGRPFKKTDKDFKQSSSKSFGGRFSESKRSDRNSRFDKPFKRPGDSEGSSGKSFSKKSRFARPTEGPGRDAGSSGTGGFGKKPFSRDANPARPRRSASERPFKKSSGTTRFSSKDSGGKGRFQEGGNDGPKGRSDSFGKPFKKSYKVKSDNESGSAPNISGIRPRRKRVGEESSTAPKSDKVRLNKFIANSGISSRREADELITLGLISVNGKIISELGYKVNPGDEVRYEDKVLRAEKPVYILMNKPKGFLTTTDDPQDRKTVMHIIGSAVKERIYPVGRLDRNTTGLLLLTNDGDLADRLMHPSFNVKKIYKVELDRPLAKADFQAILEGVRLEEGRAIVDDLATVSDDGRTVGLELHIGWNRVVRRIFESLDYEVVKLDRSVYAGLDKKELSRGQWRFLTKEEIIHLKHFK